MPHLSQRLIVRKIISVDSGDAKVNQFGNRFAVTDTNQNIVRLDVTMNNAVSMRVGETSAGLHHQNCSLFTIELMLFAKLRNRQPLDIFHDCERLAIGSGTDFE